MTIEVTTNNLLEDLGKVAKTRSLIADGLDNINSLLESAEKEGESRSGKLELEREIIDLKKNSTNLREGVFRLLVLGDMKRGKSTFLNALLGENFLPSDVNPCTALLTILRYGKTRKVTIYFNDDSSPEIIDFKEFKRKYTIDPAEAKKLEQEKKLAFPNVEYALVEYPLPLLEKGIEIVDSPGLNDTEARNELSLNYINNCHAILFVLRATQPCTLGEQRYLENYIKDRGLSIFFLINGWDQIKDSLIDPDDVEELEEAEYKLHRLFRANLSQYCQIEERDLYQERVFPISSLMALRKRIKDTNASLEGTGFPAFIDSLNAFLTQKRANAEFHQSKTLAEQTYYRINEIVELRIPLLEQDITELKTRIDSVKPEFELLNEIRDDFKQEIRDVRDKKSKFIANDFKDFVLGLGDTFEMDFIKYQPDLNFFDFLSSGKREDFEKELALAFEKYIQDKLADWSRFVEAEMETAFAQLSKIAISYGTDYNKVTDKITEKLTGKKIKFDRNIDREDNAPGWAKWAAGIFSLARGNLAGVALAGAGFDWKNIMLNFVTVIGIGGIITALTGIILGPIEFALLGLGIGVVQADTARKELVKVAKKELVKYLPQVAEEQAPKIDDAIQECFKVYEQEITDRMDDDINSRKTELENLIEQKESVEINQNQEKQRLQELEHNIKTEFNNIEQVYQDFVVTKS